LIAKQEKLIELLEEQRKSISHAVTKGLDSNAPMKDSGVEWLGDVPSHWKVTFIKYITNKISSGKTPLGGAEVYTDHGVIFLRSQNIYNDGLRLDDVSFIPSEIHISMKSSTVKNDVLLNITGGSIGRTCLVDRDIGDANVNQHVCIIRASKEKYSKWIAMFMKSNSAQAQISYSQTGAGRGFKLFSNC
jgi:type I restriction enzyme S subunit